MSRLDLVVGPNGAGKSTFVEFVLSEQRPGTVFVNADVIAAERWPGEYLRRTGYLLVEFEDGSSLFDVLLMQDELSELLGPLGRCGVSRLT